MDYREPFALQPRAGAYFFSLLILLAGVFAFRGDLLGSPFASEFAETATDAPAPSKPETVALLPQETIEAMLSNPRKVTPLPPEHIDTETLWLARAVYSETKRPEEQELVAWVVRNRVETRYRSQSTYRGVVLDPYQFSAFNPGHRKRSYYLNLTPSSQASGWQRTLALAYAVRHAPATLRPFSKKTRHFYSEQSMIGRRHPKWVEGLQPIQPKRPVQLDVRRFRFYTGVL